MPRPVTPPPAHDPVEVLTALRRARVTQAEIARRCGVAAPAVWQVINGRRPTARIQDAIAEATGLPVTQLFPRRADEAAGSQVAAA